LIYYFPSCQFHTAHPETSAFIKAYLKRRWNAETRGCCRSSWAIQNNDLLIIVCLSCQAILKERFPACSVVTIYDLLQQDADFHWPDAQGQAITIQDCARADTHLRTQVRSILRKMNFTIHETVHFTPTCGTLLMNPISERNWRSAPVYFKALEDHITILDRAEQQKLLKIQADSYSERKVVAYCNSCYQALCSMNIEHFHLLDLIFTNKQLIS